MKGVKLTLENAQNVLDAFLADESLKPIICSLMPHVLCSELPVERTFSRDKTATSYRNLSMQLYGRLKRPHLAKQIRVVGQVEFSQHHGAKKRYANQPGSTASGTPSNPNIP